MRRERTRCSMISLHSNDIPIKIAVCLDLERSLAGRAVQVLCIVWVVLARYVELLVVDLVVH